MTRPDLRGKVAAVTGGTGVLCSGFCRALAACGAHVLVMGRTPSKVDALVDEITLSGGSCSGLCADVTDREQLDRAAAETERMYGGVDILICGAGGNDPRATTAGEYYTSPDEANGKTTFSGLDADAVSAVFDLNFKSVVLTVQAFERLLLGRSDPVIITVSSMNSFRPLTKIPAYSAAKAALSNLTMWLAVHYSRTGLRVNSIAPGFFVTEQNRTLLFSPAGTPTPRTGKILAHTPMGRFGEPRELEGTLLWLCDSEASGFVTGAVIPVDGGFAAYSGV